MPLDYDYIVVGSGPAGSTAALHLARAGAKVGLLDAAELPRYKTCGGGVLARAMHRLPSAASSAVEREFHAVQLNLLDCGLQFVTQREQPIVYMTMRSHLDAALTREAVSVGAQLIEDCRVQGIRWRGEAIELTTSKGIVTAQAVVAADGATSKIAREAGWAESRQLVPALECELDVSDKLFAQHSAAVRFDFGAIDHGYAWVFPKGEHLSVGILTMRRRGVKLQQQLHNYLSGIGINETVSAREHAFMIPVSPRSEPLAHKGVFLTGDAAGLADPVTAEGITHAIMSGELAAQAILENDTVDDAARLYQELITRRVLGELRAARRLAQLLYRWPRLRKTMFRIRGQQFAETMTDIVLGDANYRSVVSRPTTYLKALGLWRR